MSRVELVLFVALGLQAARAFSLEQWDWQSINNVHGEQYHELLARSDITECRVDWRIAITASTQSFLYRVENTGNVSLGFRETVPQLYDATEKLYLSNPLRGDDSGREVSVGEYYTWRRSVDFVLSLIRYRVLGGELAFIRWGVMSKWAPPIWIAFPDENGHIEHVNSMSEDESVLLVLASVYSEGGLAEIACILINQTNEAVSPEAMPRQSLIRITALDVPKAYVVPLSQDIDPQIEVAAGGHHIWRLPWSIILNAIDEATMAGVLDAGVRIDLTWQLGEHTSTVLPIAIMPPTERERGQ